MLFSNGFDLNSKLEEFLNSSIKLNIICPYIKFSVFEQLITNLDNINSVFVRWEPKDLIVGSSDLEIYSYLKERGIPLFRNPRIHLKVYLDNYERCFLTTANISSRALNLPPHDSYNYEIGTIVENLDFQDRLYFSMIENESVLITDSIYLQIKEQLNKFSKEDLTKDFDLKLENPDKTFLISSLPLTETVEVLYQIYLEPGEHDKEIVNCALHDLALYKIPFGLNYSDFRNQLSFSFFNQEFVKSFLKNLEANGEIYFGSAKEWIHKNCEDVPLPRRWEITRNIQILYRWIIDLGNGKYEVDRPNYSERLRIK
jgi:hypothetical protein